MLLTVRDVARTLNVSIGCVYALVSKGGLAHLRVGLGRGCIRVRQDDLDAFLAERRVERNQPAPRPPRPKLKHLWLSS